MNFCKWFFDKYKEGMKIVSLFLIANLGIYILFLMLTPFLPLFSNVPLVEYKLWLHIAMYTLVCLFSALGLMFYFIIVGVYENYVKDASGKKITFKVKPQWVVYTVAMVIIFTFVGYNGGYENGDSDGFTEGLGIGIRAGLQQPYYMSVLPASMRSGIDPIFAHNATVSINGSVPAEVSLTEYLIIENTDDERVAISPLILSLVNPVTLKEGLHKDLQTNYTKIIITIDGVQNVLYQDGNYTNGVLIDAIEAGDMADMTMTFTLEIADVGSFQDGQSYTNYLFLYQSKSEYADKMPFMVNT